MNGLLLEIEALRSGAAYRAAEVLRRRTGAAAMASYPNASEQYAAVRLLIGTWDAIAARVLAGDIPKEPFFDTNPVAHMWDALAPAIKSIKKSGEVSGDYARNFARLYRAYIRWTKTKAGKRYRTKAAQAIHSRFG